MNHVCLPLQVFQQCECSTRKECEAHMIIGVSVDVRSGEQFRGLNQVRWHTSGLALECADGVDLSTPFNRYAFDNLIREEAAIDLIEQRKNKFRIDLMLAKS